MRTMGGFFFILKTLTAFANTAGGVLLIGIEDGTKDVLGLKNPLDEEERLCSLIADSIEPRLVPNVELISWQDRTLIAVEVYPSGSRPHWLKSEGPMEGVHVRLGSTNRQADIDLIQELRRSALGAAFDEQPLPETEIDELDFRGAVTCFSRYRKLTKKDLETSGAAVSGEFLKRLSSLVCLSLKWSRSGCVSASSYILRNLSPRKFKFSAAHAD